VILVAIVVLLFLQDWKSLALPLIDVGVSLVGTLAVMRVMGFTLNNLTLFGLVLAIGIVVDDAIVVLENIERWIALGYPVREATIRAMQEITGPILAITLVLSSVFLPSALLGGISGQFYRQFALTIAASMIISAINAMTMTPARAGAVFKGRKPGEASSHGEALPPLGIALGAGLLAVWLGGAPLAALAGWGTAAGAGGLGARSVQVVLFLAGAAAGWGAAGRVNRVLNRFFRGFNAIFAALTEAYGRLVGRALRLSFVVLLVYGGLIALTGLEFTRAPRGFIPSQDKGYLLADVALPDSASLERSTEVLAKLEKIARQTPGVAHTLAVPGQSFVLDANSSNYGSMFIVLDPFDRRRGPSLSADEIAACIRQRSNQEILEGAVEVFGAPPVEGLSNAGGFKLLLQKRGDISWTALAGQADNFAEQANRVPGIVGAMNSFRADTPQLYLDVDRTKAKTLGVPLSDVFDALQVFLGGCYVNDFNRFDRTWQVNVQAEPRFRVNADALRRFQVRNASGRMVPLGTIVTVREIAGPAMLTRYNTYPAATINGGWLPGVSTGTVIRRLDELSAKVLPASVTSQWTELTLLQKLAGNSSAYAFAGAVILVFLVLAAQYESWSLPLAVILVVPMCLLCALVGVALAHWDVNIFVQVGFVVLVGLASKNAILVVEFAKEQQARGRSAAEAAREAAKVRLRPIIMTSLAFILGVLPLVVSHGAGAEMRQTLGIAVFSGMLGVTVFGLVLTPVFYYVIMKLTGRAAGESAGTAAGSPGSAELETRPPLRDEPAGAPAAEGRGPPIPALESPWDLPAPLAGPPVPG
jgi:multidrug efflux pump subunit AcrB